MVCSIKTIHSINRCSGTGRHADYVRIYTTSGTIAESSESGYEGDWQNLSFPEPFLLKANETYNYTVRTGSYPQLHHNSTLLTANGWITCTSFTDANGKEYNDWIPAIRLYF